MKILYKCSIVLILLSMTTCSPAATAITQPASDPQSAATEVPPPTPAPTFKPAVLTVDQKIEAYLNGEIDDVGDLSSSELAEFSNKLVAKKNAERGIRPVIYNNEAYVDPITGMMKNYDGHPDMYETIEMFVPIAGKDADGNLQFTVDGQIETIKDSAGVDWNMVVTDPHDTRINWPTDNLNEEGLSTAQYAVEHGAILIPWVLLSTNLGQLYLDGENAEIKPTFDSVIIETDSVGNPICARKIISFGVSIGLSEEGSDSYIRQPWQSWYEVKKELPSFYQKLMGGQLYWMITAPDQQVIYEGIKNTLDGYENVADVSDVGSVLINQIKGGQKMLVVGILYLIQKTN